MDIYDTGVYKLNRQCLSLCGLWPFEVSLASSRIKKHIVDTALTVFVTLQVLKFFTSPYSLMTLLEILAHLLPTLCVVTSYISFRTNVDNIKNILESIRDDWSSVKSNTEKDIIWQFAEKGRMFTLFLTMAYYTTMFNMLFLAAIPLMLDSVLPLNETRIRKLPIQMECFVDPNVYFLEILFLTYVLMTIQGVAAISTWTTFVMIIQHICGMFELTGHVIENAIDQNGNEIHADKARARLIRGIKLHKRTINLLEVMNALIEYANLIDSSLAVLLFGVDFVHILQTELAIDNFMTNAMSITYFVGHVCFMFLTCHIGQEVLDHSSSVFEKACRIPWYYASQDIQKLVIVVIMRTMKPGHMSLGGLFISSHELFAGVIRMSMSYATVFYSLQ